MIKLAFLGCGDVAQRDYLPELHRLRGQAELVAVCGRTEARARAVAQEYGGAWYTDYERMLAESDADAVVNLTPIQMHTETTLASLRANKHVYSEKPVATTVTDVRRIQDEARQRGLKLVCAPCVMLFPQVVHAQALLANGAIGQITAVRGLGHGGVPPWGGYQSDPSPFFAEGGGPAMDMGVYPLHALTGLLGPARRVMSMSSRTAAGFTVQDGPASGTYVPIEVDDNRQMIIDLGGARLASIDANNCVQGTRAPMLEIFGRMGTIALNLLDVSAPIELLRADKGWQTIPIPQTGRKDGPDHLLGIAHLVDCIERGAEPVLSIEHALHVVEIIESAARSSVEGCAITITSTFGNADGGTNRHGQ